jgi:hypothetical protein
LVFFISELVWKNLCTNSFENEISQYKNVKILWLSLIKVNLDIEIVKNMPFTKRELVFQTFEKGEIVFFDLSRPQTFETRCIRQSNEPRKIRYMTFWRLCKNTIHGGAKKLQHKLQRNFTWSPLLFEFLPRRNTRNFRLNGADFFLPRPVQLTLPLNITQGIEKNTLYIITFIVLLLHSNQSIFITLFKSIRRATWVHLIRILV